MPRPAPALQGTSGKSRGWLGTIEALQHHGSPEQQAIDLPKLSTGENNARFNVGLQGVQVAEGATQAAIAYALDRVQGARAGAPARIVEHPDCAACCCA